MRRLALILVVTACGGSDDPCDGVAATCITARITSSSVIAIDTLQLDISYEGFHATTATTAESPTSLPLVTALELGGATVPVTVDIVVAGKLAGAVLGTAYQQSEPLDPGAHATVSFDIAALANPCLEGTYCGGGDRVDGEPDTLYLCHPGGVGDPDGTVEADVPTARGRCLNGCIENTCDDDLCFGGNLPCTDGNNYCGGHKLNGDPQILYRCDPTASKPPVVADCSASGKQCVPIAADMDACR